MGFRVIEKDRCVWICLGDRVLMYVDAEGSLHVAGDVIAFSPTCSLPPIPESTS